MNFNSKDPWEDDNWPQSEKQQWEEYQEMLHRAADGRDLTDDDHMWDIFANSDLDHVYSDSELEKEIENFYTEIVEYAEELKLPVSYVEDEFVILGELIKETF